MTVLALAALVLGLVLTAGGCSSDAEPSPMPTPPSSPSEPASESPSATPPAMPAEASGTSPAAAKAFARYFVQTINFGMESGDTSALRSGSTPECQTCVAIADKIDQSYEGSAYLEGAGWKPQGFEYIRIAPAEALVSVPVRISAQRTYASVGADPVESESTRGNLDLRMRWSAGRWLVTRMDATQ